MDEPPPYDHGYSGSSNRQEDQKVAQSSRLSIVEQVGVSRSQRVAVIVNRLLQQVRDRAQNGLSKTQIHLLPLDQEAARTGQLVGHPDTEPPLIVELDAVDSLEFWSQEHALKDLQQQLLGAVLEGVPHSQSLESPTPPSLPSRTRSSKSWWRTRGPDTPSAPHQPSQVIQPVTTVVQMDELYFRQESAYGLIDTRRAKTIMVVVVVRL